MVRTGRLAALLELVAFHVCLLSAVSESQEAPGTNALCGSGAGGRSDVLSHAEQFCGDAIQRSGERQLIRRIPSREGIGRQWVEPAASISGDGDSSADALSRLYRIYDSFRVCPRRAARQISR